MKLLIFRQLTSGFSRQFLRNWPRKRASDQQSNYQKSAASCQNLHVLLVLLHVVCFEVFRLNSCHGRRRAGEEVRHPMLSFTGSEEDARRKVKGTPLDLDITSILILSHRRIKQGGMSMFSIGEFSQIAQ